MTERRGRRSNEEALESSADPGGSGKRSTSAGGWREGLSAAKPYEGVPEVNLSERMGYMMFGPVNGKSIENSCQRICVYLPRTDVKAGEGLLHVCAAGEEPEELCRRR